MFSRGMIEADPKPERRCAWCKITSMWRAPKGLYEAMSSCWVLDRCWALEPKQSHSLSWQEECLCVCSRCLLGHADMEGFLTLLGI